jgi:hypothetical protein
LRAKRVLPFSVMVAHTKEGTAVQGNNLSSEHFSKRNLP